MVALVALSVPSTVRPVPTPSVLPLLSVSVPVDAMLVLPVTFIVPDSASTLADPPGWLPW